MVIVLIEVEALLIHTPHCSIYIPENMKSDILISEKELEVELLRLTDRYANEIFEYQGAVIIKNQYSRLIFDPERFRNENEEVMAQVGMGAVYTRTSNGTKLRELSDKKRELILRKFYDPYQLEFEKRVEDKLLKYNKCIIVDGHSFASLPLPHELDQDRNRPDICIGTCEYHTNDRLANLAIEYFRKHNLAIKLNSPFTGTFVPIRHYKKDKRVQSIMIEINRRLYMNEETGTKLDSFSYIKGIAHGFVTELLENMT